MVSPNRSEKSVSADSGLLIRASLHLMKASRVSVPPVDEWSDEVCELRSELLDTEYGQDLQGKTVIQIKLPLTLSRIAITKLEHANNPRIVIITGPSGGGKSTLINHIALGLVLHPARPNDSGL
jgi:polynucleotide 5'-kinase involved in rRNA processing